MKPADGSKRLLITDIGMLTTPVGNSAKRGKCQSDVKILHDAWILCEGNMIADIGEGRPVAEGNVATVSACNCLVTPGLVDAHTHLVFGGWRQNEFGLKLHGVGYLEILRSGGGILSTVSSTRNASHNELMKKGLHTLDVMLKLGTTTVEAKSGYGLNLDDEVKLLAVISELNGSHPIDLVPTFMGAHAVPPEYKDDRSGYVDFMVKEVIPAVAAGNMAEFCDVFCESNVFDVEESRTILECAKSYGLGLKLHADEITCLGGAQLAAEIGATSAEHLLQSDDAGLEALASSGTVAVCLPTTSFYRGESYARARKMIDVGIPVAVATDFNPGSTPNENLQLAMNLACLKYGMTPEEVLTAVTLNAAAAINRASDIGSIEVGKAADMVIWQSPDLNYLFYHYGTNLAGKVIKRGEVVCNRGFGYFGQQ